MLSDSRQHSFRSSCERCRSHKVKCDTPSQARSGAPPQCTRCTRAKAECIFRRRAPPRHRASSATVPTSTSIDISSTASMAAMAPSAIVSSVSSKNIETGPSTTTNQPTKSPNGWQTFFDRSTPEVIDTELSPFALLTVPPDSETSKSFNIDMSASTLHTGLASSYTEQQFSLDSSSPKSDYDELEELIMDDERRQSCRNTFLPSDTNSSHSIIRLSSLLKEIHETKHMLGEKSISYTTMSTALAEYPIGRVLHAAQTFNSIVANLASQISQVRTQATEPIIYGSLSETTEFSRFEHTFVTSSILMDRNMLEQGEHSSEDPPLMYPASPATELDTSTTMLVFCCYVDLSKLYCTVFQFFEDNLHSSSRRADDCRSVKVPLEHTRMLQLGELSTGDDTELKVLKAVRMLLDVFQLVEIPHSMPDPLEASNTTKPLILPSDEVTSSASSLQQHLSRILGRQRVLLNEPELEQVSTRLRSQVGQLKVLLRLQNGLH